ncbi:DNA primase [Pseudomonadales bacterium]|nr:DNA primase [Pseudomonadales bacterium]MDB9918076.1 DNA primase [Pseudomonadales bacterium]MDC0013403.1 DNA primase [Pseudomonadales bacterium]MDC1307474.1 DNA primase [Pseudomonadales bacterium]MDC1368028.1 DNA primase [Pseudomonadales bacterium]
MIAPEFIDELLARTDIVEVVQSRVVLKKTGQNYTGLCPFHKEKSPSFSVSQDKQFYYCFGCQASGSALKFIMEFERLEFLAAIEMLAGNAGMQVPQTSSQGSPERNERRKSIYNILEQSAHFYQVQLKQHSHKAQAIDYLKARGVSGEIARDFGLGYAPPGWDNLYKDQAKTNLEHDLLIESGMVVNNKDEDKTYDRFRDRIMFPIRDIRGRVIAFGGRILGDGQPKYLNSPETPVFHKGRELYGLFEARKRTQKLTQFLVVEGYMDVVALAQNDINYAVATLGTATSGEHLERMFRLVSRLVFCFDGDNAGRNAAWKALMVALPLMRDGRSARFLFLPDGEDPDSLVRKEGKDKFEWRLDQAQPLPDFFFNKLQADIDIKSLDGKAHLSNLAMPMINEIPSGVFKQLMIEQLSILTGLAADKLVAASASVAARYVPSAPKSKPTESTPQGAQDAFQQGMSRQDLTSPAQSSRESIEFAKLVKMAIAMLLRQPELSQQFDEKAYSRLEASPGSELLLELIHAIVAREITSPLMLLATWQDRPEFDYLRDLIEQEQLLDVSELPEEFTGVINTLLRLTDAQSGQLLRADLLSKPFDEMSESEREMLRNLVKSRQQRK